MATRRPRRTPRLSRLILLAAGAGAIVAGIVAYRGEAGTDTDGVPTAPVRRVTLFRSIVEDGEVDSSEKTLIEAELENVQFRNGGAEIQASGSSIIIELVPEGTTVEAGQVLCRLDSSEYEEMVRQQQIELEEDLAEYNSARLTVETLEIQLREYRDGLFRQEEERLLGALAMARADVERQRDRLAWTERMAALGYVTESQLAAEGHKRLETEFALRQSQLALRNLVEYTAPKRLIELQSQIDGAVALLKAHETRVAGDREQLAEYRQQLAYCTIRAPHAGFLIYANEDEDDTRIELGASIREDQDLFFLPDLSQMEVRAKMHESVVARVEPGMPARIRIEALPDALLEGEVVHVASLPTSLRSRYRSDEVKNYECRVKLHAIPEGLLPGMSAQVEILIGSKPNALVIPWEALAVEGGDEVCYVRVSDGFERRVVTVGSYHPRLVEVVDGLAAGERVVTDPDRIARHAVPRPARIPGVGTLAVADLRPSP